MRVVRHVFGTCLDDVLLPMIGLRVDAIVRGEHPRAHVHRNAEEVYGVCTADYPADVFADEKVELTCPELFFKYCKLRPIAPLTLSFRGDDSKLDRAFVE